MLMQPRSSQPQPDPIVVEGLVKRYRSTVAVDDLSFRCRRGRITGFLGPNGAGKTTTLQVLLGLTRPEAGRAELNGQEVTELSEPATTVGALLDHGGAHPGRSGRNHLGVLATAAGLPRERVDAVLDLVGMTEVADRRVRSFSLGMRQRLGIAAALLGSPEILILDEPANGLDPAGMRWLRDLLRHIADDGGTVLVSSHVLSEVAQTVDDLVIIGHGRLLTSGPLDELAAGRSLEDAYLEMTATTSEVC
jgi:ABC-2 type transport system ATP-binding protein